MKLPNRLCPGRRFAQVASLFLVTVTVAIGADHRVYVQFAKGAKGPVRAALAQAGGRVHHEFDNVDALSVSLPEQALDGVRRNPHVTLVEEDPVRVLSGQSVPYGVEMVQALDAVAAGATGAGVVIGVIDSGVFDAHEDFSGVSINGEPDLGFVNERTWYRDRSSHGTHVTGTIVAANNTLGVLGVSPGAVGIYMVKVFGDNGNWIYSSTLLAAVQQAVANGPAKIVSMSLGGGSPSNTEGRGLQALYDDGVLLIAAAGNSGNSQTSYPAGYPSVMSVAALDSAKLVASFSQHNASVEIAAPGVGVLSTVSYKDAALTVGAESFIASALEGTALETASAPLVDGGRATTTSSAWAGNVVLVERGDISFADKIQNVQNSGGRAAVIYNNAPGGFSGTLGTFSSSIPAIAITREDGITLLSRLGQTASVSTEAFLDTSGYDYFDGTSMATPHVSAVAALIWSKYMSASNAQVRQALAETAEDLGAAGRDNYYGHGLVRAAVALACLGELVGDTPPPPPGGDSTPPVISGVAAQSTYPKNGSFQITWTTDEPATSDVTIDGTPSADPDPALVTNHTRSFRGKRGQTYTFDVTSADATGNTATAGPFSFTVPN